MSSLPKTISVSKASTKAQQSLHAARGGGIAKIPSTSFAQTAATARRDRFGVIFPARLGTPAEDKRPEMLELFIEPNNSDFLENSDNVTVSCGRNSGRYTLQIWQELTQQVGVRRCNVLAGGQHVVCQYPRCRDDPRYHGTMAQLY